MRGRHYCLLIVLTALVLGQPAAKGYQETGRPSGAEGIVRFDLYRDYLIVVRGSAGPLKGLNFLLDTGASPTVLDPRIARKLRLEEHPASIAVLDGTVGAGMAIVSGLGFGPLRRNNLSVLIEDLSFLQKALPVRIDAVVGLDVLGQSPFLIDYTSREIRFGPPPPLPVSIPLRLKGGLAIVDAEVNHIQAHLLVDTGASSLIIFKTSMPKPAAALQISAAQRSSKAIGDFERNQVQLHSLRLGEAEFAQEPAFVVENGSDGVRDFDGLMSPAALGITRVAVDLGREELAFSRR